MSSNCKHNAECQSIAGPTCDQKRSGEQWKQFWVTAKTKKRQKKPLTREESKRQNKIKHNQKTRNNVIPNEKKKNLSSISSKILPWPVSQRIELIPC